MSNAEAIFANINRDKPVEYGKRYKLTKQAIDKALKKMPDTAALWGPEGTSEYDAKQAMKDALWSMVEKSVQTFQYAPDGKTLIEVK